MSKQQRLYHEQNNKERVRQELEEFAKQYNEVEKNKVTATTFDPHRNSFFN